MKFSCAVALMLAAAVPAPALADQWPGPMIRELFSQSREYFVRIRPGESIGDTYGFAGAEKGGYATAELKAGSDFVFSMESGQYRYCEAQATTFRCRNATR